MKHIVVEKDTYYDSVFLMFISQEVKKLEGVKESVVAMATEMNRKLLMDMGFSGLDSSSITPNDLIIVVEGETEEAAEEAIKSARNLLTKKREEREEIDEYRPVSLETALKMFPDSNLTIISVPGRYAAREVKKALNSNLHVMLFSDNVSIEEEIELKIMARKKGLLMMGPDCGTSIINGKPLCFANRVRIGNIGIVGASGTGIQEVSSCIDRIGGGVSQAIGTGGRDLQDEGIGGIMMLMGIEALKNDPDTRVIVVISKPPLERIAKRVMDHLKETGKPCIIHFIGLKAIESQETNLYFSENLEETAKMSLSLSQNITYKKEPFDLPETGIGEIIKRETSKMMKGQKFIRGLFTGGTLADEAIALFEREKMVIHSNIQTNPEFLLRDPEISVKHTVIDLGDDFFTLGRPHPMIDPSIRIERVHREMKDQKVALFLLDFVLGYGSHYDPAGAMLPCLSDAKDEARKRGGYLSIVASITGTSQDIQNMDEQRAKLESLGCVVLSSNYQASLLAFRIIREVSR